MAKMVGMNANYKEVAGVLRTFEGEKAFAREVLNKMVEAGSKRTFNSVNATLAAMATKGYVSKAKGVYNDKMLTQYTLTDEGRAELDKEEVAVEATPEDAEYHLFLIPIFFYKKTLPLYIYYTTNYKYLSSIF